MHPFDVAIVIGALFAIMVTATPLLSKVEVDVKPAEAQELSFD